MSGFKFAFITQDDPFYVRIFFEEFFRTYDQREDIKAVVIAPAMGKKSLFALLRQMYDFYGPFNFVRVGFKFVLYKIASRLPSWARAGRFFSLTQLCEHYGVAV